MGVEEHLENLREIEELRRDNAALKARLAERPVPYHVVTYGGYIPRTKPSGAWAILGFFIIVSIIFIGVNLGTVPLIVGAIAVFVGGFIARTAGRGAIIGFLGPFILLVLISLALLFTSVAAGSGFATVLGAVIGVVLLVASFIFGLIGAAIGAIAGAISSKVWKYKPFTPKPPEQIRV